MDINTVAAGGGSRLFYKNGAFKVGPESAGATPGPVCYGNDGFLAISDANLILGRLIPEHFPKIFGRNKNEGLFKELSLNKFKELQQSQMQDLKKNIYEIAFGFV